MDNSHGLAAAWNNEWDSVLDGGPNLVPLAPSS